MANGTIIGTETTERPETLMRLILRTGQSTGAPGGSDGSVTGPTWHAAQTVLVSGAEPSWSRCVIALAANTVETMPSVVGSNLIKTIKAGTPAKVVAEWEGARFTLINGFVVSLVEDLELDVARALVMDARFFLDGIPIMGSLRASGESDALFCLAAPCIMNEGGYPNCCLRGESLAFCPPRMGLAPEEVPPAKPEQSKASYWTLPLAVEYFRQRVSGTAPTSAPFLLTLPTDPPLRFPQGLGATLEDTTFDSTASRKVRQMDFDGLSLAAALQKICEMAGPFALGLDYDSDGFGATIKLVSTRYSDKLAYDAAFAVAGSALNVTPSTATAGTVESSVVGRYTRVAVVGAPRKIERLFTKDGSNNNLEPAWTAAEEAGFIDRLKNPPAGKTSDVEKFRYAVERYPNVFCSYRVRPAFDFQEGTESEGSTLARYPRAPEPRLYTSEVDLEEQATVGRVRRPIPIQFEVSVDNGATWNICDTNDGLEIDFDTGTFSVPGLRKESGGNYSSWSGTVEEPDYITKNLIRATLVVPTDHRLYAALRRKTDPGSFTPGSDNHPPAWEWAQGLARAIVTDAGYLYQHIERRDSYPETPDETDSFYEQPLNDVPVDDTEAIKSHAKRRFADVTAPAVTAQISYPHIFAAVYPGISIRNLKLIGNGGERRIVGCVRSVEWRSDEGGGELTVVNMG